jgi:molybdopterin-containing oxidoreductase family iron-sulfur binding subunit
MDSSRREFIKIAGVTALSVSAWSVPNSVFAATAADKPAPRMKPNPEALTATQWAMVIDTRKLKHYSDLEPMISACHKTHNVPDIKNKNHEIKWIWETEYGHAFPSKHREFEKEEFHHKPFLVLCNHCENPPCVRVCPTKATFKNEQGIVMMDFHRCIGCRYCMAACPYGSRSFNFVDPRQAIEETNKQFPTRMIGVVEKCNFCAERLAVGKMPACVEASNGALAFGDLYDPESTVRKLIGEHTTIRRKPALGTEPAVYYII